MARAPQFAAVVIVLGLVLSAVIYGVSRGLTDGFHQFTSATKGYSIRYPREWSVKSDQPVLGTRDNLTTDDFVSPDEKTQASVECVQLTHGQSVDAFLQGELNALKAGGIRDARVKDRLTVAGTEAPVIDYSFTTKGAPTYQFETVLIRKDCGWLISIGAPIDTRINTVLFRRMVTSFQLE